MDNFGVALVKRACPVCGKLQNGEIIINTRLTKSAANKVKDLHDKCVGFSEEPCDECKGLLNEAVGFIVVDLDKTEDKSIPYRTGDVVFVKKESDFIKSLDPKLLKSGYVYIDMKEAKQIGLINKN